MFQLGYTEVVWLAIIFAMAIGVRPLKVALAVFAIGLALLPFTDTSGAWVVLMVLISYQLLESPFRAVVAWTMHLLRLGERFTCR
jgi:hypothetical protein